jgi:hypothetical protein
MTSDELRIALILKLDNLSDSGVAELLERAESMAVLEKFYIKHGKEKADKLINEQLKKDN